MAWTRMNLCVRRTYFDKKTQQEKASWPRIGTLTLEDGVPRFIDIPLLGQQIFAFEFKEQENGRTTEEARPAGRRPPARLPETEPGADDDEVPF